MEQIVARARCSRRVAGSSDRVPTTGAGRHAGIATVRRVLDARQDPDGILPIFDSLFTETAITTAGGG
jgi:hypothetical protein